VDRDDPVLGRKVLSLGAFDYVEKPSFENLSQAGNEIRAKLRLATRKTTGSTANAQSEIRSFPLHAPLISKTVNKKKVLIVDDSPTIRQLLRQILSADPDLEVVAEAELPSEVEALIIKHSPHVITLDIQMPQMTGVELLKQIQPKHRIPTVMISSISREEGPMVLQALENGAIDYIQKPSLKDLQIVASDIRERVKAAANTRRSFLSRQVRKSRSRGPINKECVILLGASTGGTEALRHILESFPSEIPPIAIVQHIPPVFSAAFAQRLNTLCPFEVREAVDGDELKHNRVLIAPGGKQMGIVRRGNALHAQISDAPPVNRHKPSVDYMFNSAAAIDRFNFVAGLLTGMGADGARGLKLLRDRGARTIAQNEASCIVYGMPREAVALGAAEFVLPLDDIGSQLLDLASADRAKQQPKKPA
jgi:two-component system chemotaxis response regulator CheB